MKKLFIIAGLFIASVAAVNAQWTWGVKAGYNSSDYTAGVKNISLGIDLGCHQGMYGGFVGDWQFANKWALQGEFLYSYDGSRLGISKSFLKDLDAPKDFQKNFSLSLNSHNLRLPIMVKFQAGGGLSFLAGGYISWRFAHDVRFNKNAGELAQQALNQAYSQFVPNPADPSADPVNVGQFNAEWIKDFVGDFVYDQFRRFDAGLTFGGEYAFCNGLFIDARYSFSLMNHMRPEMNFANLPISEEYLNYVVENTVGSTKWEDIGIVPKVKYSAWQIGLGYRF